MTTDKISCLVVDDDDVDRLTLLSFIEDYPFLQVASCSSAAQALALAERKLPEVLFLDVDMPEMNGLKLRERLLSVPACIFVTSYPDYAVESFELAALDFILKPFAPERFTKTMERLKSFLDIRHKAEQLSHTLDADIVFIKDGTSHVKLHLHEIIYLEALNNYTNVVTTHRKYAVLSSLGNLIKEKTFNNFVRIHRSFAVQKHLIKKISAGEVTVENFSLPIGRKYKESLELSHL